VVHCGCRVLAASGKFYILSGQHRFEAANKIAKAALDSAKPVPAYAREFRCVVVKKGTSLDIRQVIAGKAQSTQSSVQDPTLSERLRWTLKEVENAKASLDTDADLGTAINRTQILRYTYTKTGCRDKTDGSMVCAPVQ
jgi:RecA/RadA recombinase